MADRQLDDEWKRWLQENIDRNSNAEELRAILLKNDFAMDSIKACMGRYYPFYSPLPEFGEEGPCEIDHKALSETRLTRPDSGYPVRRHPTDRVQMYTIDHFLSDQECDAIVQIMRLNPRPSATVTSKVESEVSAGKYGRTSSTSMLPTNNPVIAAVEEKITQALGIRPSYTEQLEGQHYEVGQEFRQHRDYFGSDPGEYSRFAAKLGNRTWTFMVYLNTVPQGGGTRFVDLDLIIQAQKGKALVWNNLYPDGRPNPDTLHAGMPVIEGHKDVITKWFREKGSGPMFY